MASSSFTKGGIFSDEQAFKNRMYDAIMENVLISGLSDIDSNKIYIFKDLYHLGMFESSDYDTWIDSISSQMIDDDLTHFMSMFSRSALKGFFTIKGADECRGEFMCMCPDNKKRLVMVRFIKFAKKFEGVYGEMFMFKIIGGHIISDLNETFKIQLLNGLALPYQELDLINLRNGKFYASKSGEGSFAEDFCECGYFDDVLEKFSYCCDLTIDEREELYNRYRTASMREQFAAGVKRIDMDVKHRYTEDQPFEWVRLQAFLISGGNDEEPQSAILTVQGINAEKEKDLQDKQKMEYALRAERQYKQAILSTASSVYTYNVTTDTLYDEVIEHNWVESLLPKLNMRVPCSYNEYIEKKSEYFTSSKEAETYRQKFRAESLLEMFKNKRYYIDTEYEFRIRLNSDGEEHTWIYREAAMLIQDFETEEVWGLTYLRNVTYEREQQKQVEQTLRNAIYQAERANNAKTLFMSQMSHDIRTPLNSILGMAAIAREHCFEPERVADCMKKIDESGRLLLELINNVLDLSSIESGKAILSQSAFDLRLFIDETLEAVRPLIDKKRHTLKVDIGNMNAAVVGDKAKLRQVLVNIIGNAVKYTPEGGIISFYAKETECERRDFCRYVFIIEDNGIGMSKEFIPHIFDSFVRADNKRISSIEGTGLGMPIALNIVRLMSGNIQVKSEEGKGSVFEITVCLKRGELSGAEFDDEENKFKDAKMSDFDFGGRRVLLAEDLQFNAEIASEFLKESGIISEFAHNGAEAVEMFEKSAPGYYDMIFMDIQMPELNGYQAAKNIRRLKREDAAEIPIIAMTANAFLEDVTRAMESGMNSHISKPIEMPRLISVLCRYFGEHRRNI